MPRVKKKKFRQKFRVTYNVAANPLPPLREEVPRIKNLQLMCGKCGFIHTMTAERAFKGVRCTQCNRFVIADPAKGNFRVPPVPVINSESLPSYRVNETRSR